MNLNQDIVVTARAPGKVILSGEHSVVYGEPALAIAVDRFATTTITGQTDSEISFEFLNDNLRYSATLHDLQKHKATIAKRYRKFINGKIPIKDVIQCPLELVQYAFIYLAENLFLDIKTGLKIQIEITMPIGCGMGASAAVILSLIHALVNYYGQDLTIDKYLYFGKEIENLQHGHSSGLDLYLSLYGGCYFFLEGEAHQRSLPLVPFCLVNTGKTAVSTGECVEKVAERLQDGLLIDKFANVAQAMDSSLRQGDLGLLQQAVQINNQLLCEIGIVPGRVQEFIEEVELRGNAAKVSGAGAISGDNAGIVLVVGTENITDLVDKYGYETLLVQGEADGLTLL